MEPLTKNYNLYNLKWEKRFKIYHREHSASWVDDPGAPVGFTYLQSLQPCRKILGTNKIHNSHSKYLLKPLHYVIVITECIAFSAI